MMLTAEIGAKIKYYRKKRGLKIAELAELLHKIYGEPQPGRLRQLLKRRPGK